jgi:photosystem II stability/assembly factor-like uncharacterized protein
LLFWSFFNSIPVTRRQNLPQASHLDNQQKQKTEKAVAANIVFKSTDGGKTWQDISEGLPEPVKDDNGVGTNGFFADDNGLYLTAGNGIYHSQPNCDSFLEQRALPRRTCQYCPW